MGCLSFAGGVEFPRVAYYCRGVEQFSAVIQNRGSFQFMLVKFNQSLQSVGFSLWYLLELKHFCANRYA